MADKKVPPPAPRCSAQWARLSECFHKLDRPIRCSGPRHCPFHPTLVWYFSAGKSSQTPARAGIKRFEFGLVGLVVYEWRQSASRDGYGPNIPRLLPLVTLDFGAQSVQFETIGSDAF